LSGLPSFISDKIQYDDPKMLEETIRRARCLYDQQRGRPNLQKDWGDTMKSKVEQMKKGVKAPFFINTAQGKTTLQKPIMSETVGKKSQKQPMQCWGCGKNHMHKDCPQRGDKVRATHSVRKTATIEDMGKAMPRIYATLDNKHAKFQSYMIEVKGKINDQPIAILIESGASHSYLDPKMVERFHFPRSKLRKL
jgi:hypothetical protein